MTRSVVACMVLLGAASWSSRSHAALAPALEWDAPTSCPDARALHERLTALLGHEPESSEPLRVRGVVVEDGHGLRLTLEVATGTRRNSRVFVARDCSELFEAAALAIALAVPEGSSEAATTVPQTEIAPRAAPEPADSVADSDRSTPAPSASGSAGAAAVVDFGALPSPALGVSVTGGIHLGDWSVGALASFFPAQSFRVADSTEVEFGLMTAELRSCRSLLQGFVSVQPCLGFELGRLSAWGLDLDSARTVPSLWLAPVAALEAHADLADGLQLELRAAALVPLGRKQYAINETDRVHAPAAIDFRLFAGLVIGVP